MRVNASASAYFRDGGFGQGCEVKDEGDHWIVSTMIDLTWELRRFLLSLGADVMVISPSGLAKEIADTAMKTLKQYEGK